jgi:hypothetical protein
MHTKVDCYRGYVTRHVIKNIVVRDILSRINLREDQFWLHAQYVHA